MGFPSSSLSTSLFLIAASFVSAGPQTLIDPSLASAHAAAHFVFRNVTSAELGTLGSTTITALAGGSASNPTEDSNIPSITSATGVNGLLSISTTTPVDSAVSSAIGPLDAQKSSHNAIPSLPPGTSSELSHVGKESGLGSSSPGTPTVTDASVVAGTSLENSPSPTGTGRSRLSIAAVSASTLRSPKALDTSGDFGYLKAANGPLSSGIDDLTAAALTRQASPVVNAKVNIPQESDITFTTPSKLVAASHTLTPIQPQTRPSVAQPTTVADGKTQASPPTSDLLVNPSSMVIGGQTLTPGGAAITLSGTKWSLASDASSVIIGGSRTVPLTPAAIETAPGDDSGASLPKKKPGVVTAGSGATSVGPSQSMMPGASPRPNGGVSCTSGGKLIAFSLAVAVQLFYLCV